jgi:hypothetical protein
MTPPASVFAIAKLCWNAPYPSTLRCVLPRTASLKAKLPTTKRMPGVGRRHCQAG